MNLYGMLALLFMIWIIGIAGTAWQLYHYRKVLRDYQKKYDDGYLGVGMSKSNFKPKKIILLMTNQQGIIKECKIMSGLTIFAHFKSYEKWDQYQVNDIPENLIKSKYNEPLKEAIQLINKEMKRKPEIEHVNA